MVSLQHLAVLERAPSAADTGATWLAPAAARSSVVLVIQHDPLAADEIVLLLQHAGYTPRLAADNLSALQDMAAGGVDLVLLDLDLPARNGLALCRQVRAAVRDEQVHLPILALMPTTCPEARSAVFDAGADDYVPKPFYPGELLARIRVALRVRELTLDAMAHAELLGIPAAFLRAADTEPPRMRFPPPPPPRDDTPATDAAVVARAAARPRPALPVPDRETMWPELTEPLTPRECDVLQLLTDRFTNREVADALSVSWQTVAKHTNNIYQKLRVKSRREAVARATALGILPADRTTAGGA
jgi:DNA-binding NarL/FixJ family response regulator